LPVGGNPLPPKETRNRCMHFPSCQIKDSFHLSAFHHPSESCPYFDTDKCGGIYCAYKHKPCPKGRFCTGLECKFEHSLSQPTLLRIHFDAEKRNAQMEGQERTSRTDGRVNDDRRRGQSRGAKPNRRIRSRSRRRMEEEEEERKYSQNNPPSPVNRPVPSNGFSTKDRRCHYFPHCKKGSYCEFAHPSQRCESFPNCIRGRDCPDLHGDCPNDGKQCANEYCPFEHRKQKPPRVAAYHARSNANRSGNVSRGTSMSNLSMISGDSRR
ncbi:hypothetical protein PMAYCL1PPCAC_23127, partial [Pristionchus mayeri]